MSRGPWHVAVLMGGWSAERPVSLSSGEGVAKALESRGHRVTRIDLGRDVAQRLAEELVTMVRSQIGPVADFKDVAVVEALPKTRSGKILRGTMKKIADHEPWTMPATIEDPKVLDEIGDAVKGRGMGV